MTADELKHNKVTGRWQLVITIPILLLDAAVIMYGWNTFVTASFNVPKLHLVLTLGLSVWFNYLIMKPRDRESSELTWYKVISGVTSASFTWLVMYVIHFFV